jgi:hypothetical protein
MIHYTSDKKVVGVFVRFRAPLQPDAFRVFSQPSPASIYTILVQILLKDKIDFTDLWKNSVFLKGDVTEHKKPFSQPLPLLSTMATIVLIKERPSWPKGTLGSSRRLLSTSGSRKKVVRLTIE